MDRPALHLDDGAFRRLIGVLLAEFDQVIAPVLVDGVVRLRPIADAGDITVGIVDAQETGSYRTEHTGTPRRFACGPGPDSAKGVVHPPEVPIWTMRRGDDVSVSLAGAPSTSRAIVGLPACDVRALGILGRTQLDGPHPDPDGAARRAGLFVVTVDCTAPSPTCFCVSSGGRPTAADDFDIGLTELPVGRHAVEYVARAGSAHGAALLGRVTRRPASTELVHRATAAIERAEQTVLRELPADAATIVDAPDHPRWDDVAERCLACGNCTAVCPTCFCTDVRDTVSLDGETATRHRVWDTCFSGYYSTLGGSPHRSSTRSRYRQWLTHKVGTWHEQFGESGCVGCGRCVTWCPVGIDMTAEIEALLRPVEATS